MFTYDPRHLARINFHLKELCVALFELRKPHLTTPVSEPICDLASTKASCVDRVAVERHAGDRRPADETAASC